MFNIYVRFKTESTEFALWPIMRDHRTKEVYVGSLAERYPTAFTKRTLGRAVAALYKKLGSQLARVEVKEEPDYDNRNSPEYAGASGGQSGSPGYAEASGVWN